MKERDSGVKAITTALKALPAEEQMPTLLAKYAEMAEENKRLQVLLSSSNFYPSVYSSLTVKTYSLT